MSRNHELIAKVAEKNGGSLPCFKTASRAVNTSFSGDIIMNAAYVNTDDPEKEHIYQNGVDHLSTPSSGYKLSYELSYVKVSDLQKIHNIVNGVTDNNNKTVILSVDGVRDSNRTSTESTIVSLKFFPCNVVFPILIYKPTSIEGPKLGKLELLLMAMQEFKGLGITIKCFSCDAPVRAELLCMNGHVGYYSCSICTAKGQQLQCRERTWDNMDPRIRELAKGEEIFSEMRPAMLRTHELWLEWSQEAEEINRKRKESTRRNFNPDKLKNVFGIYRRTELIDYVEDITTVMVPEYMHLICLGIVERMFKNSFTFKGKDVHKRKQHRYGDLKKLISTKDLDEAICKVKLPSEFSRKSRAVCLQYTAQEWRNLSLVMFPLLDVHCSDKRISDLFLIIAFCVRFCMLEDTDYYLHLRDVDLAHLLKYFGQKYRKLYGDKNSVYNAHVVEHLALIREMGAFHETSAFHFEHSYANLKESMRRSPQSRTKYGLTRALLKLQMEEHVCQRRINYRTSAQQCDKTLDFLAYQRSVDGAIDIYKLIEQRKDGKFVAVLGRKDDYYVKIGRLSDIELPFWRTGVFNNLHFPANALTFVVDPRDLDGKVVEVDGIFVTVSSQMLREC
jgi:hypothetical protein